MSVTTTHNSYLQRMFFYASYRKLIYPPLIAMENLVYLLSDKVVTVSEKSYSFTSKYLLFDNSKAAIINNGVDTSLFKPQESHYLQDKLNLSLKNRIILYVGRVAENKHPLPVIKALKHLDPHYSLVIVGDGPFMPSINRTVDELQLANRVYHLENVPYEKMPSVYNSADVIVHYSKSEVGPFVLLEAAACGIPMIANRETVALPVLKHQLNGFFCDFSKPAKLASLIQKAYNNKYTMGKKGRQIVFEKHLSWTDIAKRYETLYYNILNRT